MGLDDFVDVLSKEYFYSKAVNHRKQKQAKLNRFKGRLISVAKNQQRALKSLTTVTEFQSFYSDITQQSEQYNEDMDRLKEMASYVYQVRIMKVIDMNVYWWFSRQYFLDLLALTFFLSTWILLFCFEFWFRSEGTEFVYETDFCGIKIILD